MKQERIEFFENLLSKPMAEPHRSWIEELLASVKEQGTQPAKAKGKHAPANVPVIEQPNAHI